MKVRVVGIAIAIFGLQAASAQAVTVIGQSPPSGGMPETCTSADFGDVVQLESTTGNSYVIPEGGGVITLWRTSLVSGTLDVRLRIFTRDGNNVTPVGESEAGVLAGTDGPKFFPARIPVTGGELLGMSVRGSGTGCANSGAAPGDILGVHAAPVSSVGQPEELSGPLPTLLANVSADLEPDADGDGFGDESQDAIFTKTPKKKTESEKATFRFTGSESFQCRIDKKAFKPCTSPKRLHNLKVRKHRFRIRPVDAQGTVGPADSFRWRVVD